MKRRSQIITRGLAVLLFILPALVKAGDTAKLSTFPLSDVKLLNSPFREAQQTDLEYIMKLDPDRLLAPFLREAGLTPKAESYPNWENTGLDGHIGGHYLSALSLMYASTQERKLLDRLNYMLNELKIVQETNGNGYIGGVPGGKAFWTDVAAGKFQANSFDINKKWVPLYNIHKTYAGLRDAWLHANIPLAKKMLIDFTNWMINETSQLSDSQVQQLLRSEHGGLNETFADVYQITGHQKYLDLARRFSHRQIMDPLVQHEDRLNNIHANTQIPKIIGFEKIASVSGDTAFHQAAQFFWNTVVNNRTVAIGGNSVREHFNPANDFTSMITSEQGPETCNTYNMLRLTKQLYEAAGSEHYIGYYERSLYNHILSTQHPEGGFVYFTPMRPGHYRVYSQPQTSFWCCVGSGLENHGKYGEMIYAHSGKDLYVNLFIPSVLDWKDQGLQVKQQTRFPDEETTTLEITAAKNKSFTLYVRYPSWVADNALSIAINGKPQTVKVSPGEYVALTRSWRSGDKITVKLPMRTTTEQLPDGSDYVAVLHGPIVLAAKTDTVDMPGLFSDASRMGHVARGKQLPLQEMPMFVTNVENISPMIQPVPGKPMTFSASEIIHPSKYKSLELIPFFRLHNSRYVIYWRKVTPGKLAAIQEATAAAEAEKQALDARTIDIVYPGEQQPESDHFIQTEKSTTGINQERRWRDATGWFSYRLTDVNKQAAGLRVTYFGGDRDRRFTILVNDKPIAEVHLNDKHGDNFYSVDYAIPQDIVNQSNGVLTVKFSAAEGSVAGGVYGVRLMK